MPDFLPAHRTSLLSLDGPLDAFCAKDVAASRGSGSVVAVVGVSAHLFEADGALATAGLKFRDELLVHGGADGALEVRKRVPVAPRVRGVAQVVVDEFAGGSESNGCFVDGVEVFGDSEQELGPEGPAAVGLDDVLELGDGVLG